MNEHASIELRDDAPTARAMLGARPGLGRRGGALDTLPTDERSLMQIYLGPNQDKFLETYERVVSSGSPFAPSFVWPAFLLPVAWMLYRKLWVPAVLFMFLPMMIVYVTGVKFSALAITAALAVVAKPMYVLLARAQIKRIAAREPDPERLRAKVAAAGGVSIPGMIIGILITGLGLALIIFRFAVLYYIAIRFMAR
jgi:hypothetical protein